MGNLNEYKTESLQRLSSEKRDEYKTIVSNEELTDEQIESAEALAVEIDEIDNELASRTEKAEKVEALRGKFAAAESDEDEDEAEEAEEVEAEAEVEEAAEEEVVEAAEEVEVKAKTSGVEALSAKTPRPKAPALSNSPVVITAAADVPDYSTGQVLEAGDVQSAMVSRMRAFSAPSGDGSIENLQRYGVAKFKMDFPDELTVTGRGDDLEVLNYASKESRLSGGSLTAAGGWCAPSETLYDLCVTETMDGILSLPEINVARGGINFTKGPDFSAIMSNVGFQQTEAQAIAGTAKTCFEVPCPPFTDKRLDAIGLCIKAPILTNAAYPELVQRWIDGSMVAHAHKVNAAVITAILAEASTGAALAVGDFTSTAQNTLAALELLADRKRQQYALGLNETLEVVVPFWVKGAIRSDLSIRTGIEPAAITDEQIRAHFAARHLNVQYVYDWQPLPDFAVTEGYPATYDALIYPAGTFVKGTSNVITLDAVYDAAELSTNVYTALFFEQGLLVANVCTDADVVTLPVCNSGHTGAANISECQIGADV